MSNTNNTMLQKSRTLKDFLNDNSNSTSYSSNGFKSLPRTPTNNTTTMRSLIEIDLNASSSTRIFNSLINSILRKISSSFTVQTTSSSKKKKSRGETEVTVRIKDIVRWRSFRDLVDDEEQSQPLDFSTTTTTTTTTTSSCSSSNGSSWCESDFTCGYSSSCDGNFGEFTGRKGKSSKRFSVSVSPGVGRDSVYATTGTAMWAKEDSAWQEELESPVSVLQIGEDEFLPFDQSLANIEWRKQKCMQTKQRYDNEEDRIERRAKQLLQYCVKASDSAGCNEAKLDQVLMDFFMDELNTRRINYLTRINDDNDDNDDGFEWEIIGKAQDWIDGSFEYGLEHFGDKDDCIREMYERETWNKFEREQEELAREIESDLLKNLVVEIFNNGLSLK